MPYFDVPARNMEEFKRFCRRFVEKTAGEPKCLYYGFSFAGNQVHCREAYADAEGVLAHLDNVAELNLQALHLATITRYEVHGPAQELTKLRGPLAFLNPAFYVVEYGFRRAGATEQGPGPR